MEGMIIINMSCIVVAWLEEGEGEKDGTEEGGMGEVAWLRGGRKPKVL